jgi:hypothetical protein
MGELITGIAIMGMAANRVKTIALGRLLTPHSTLAQMPTAVKYKKEFISK